MDKFKNCVITLFAATGAIASQYLGGMDNMLKSLIFFAISDYLTGLTVCLVFKNSPKTDTGGASSKASFRGVCKKFMMFLFVAIAVQIDGVLGTDNFFREAAIWGFLANELFSIIENAGLMGLKIPPAFSNAFDVLSKKQNDNKGVN